MTEICLRCYELATPWQWVEELQGHVCCRCAYELVGMNIDEISDDPGMLIDGEDLKVQ
jgi:hypothetical protein